MIVQTKEYQAKCDRGQFKIFLSEHSDKYFCGSVFYYEKKGSWAKGQDVNIDLKQKQFADFSEETVYKQCVDWIKQNIDPNAQVEGEGAN